MSGSNGARGSERERRRPSAEENPPRHPTHRLLSSSFLWFIFRFLQASPKKELLRSLWVNPKPKTAGFKLSTFKANPKPKRPPSPSPGIEGTRRSQRGSAQQSVPWFWGLVFGFFSMVYALFGFWCLRFWAWGLRGSRFEQRIITVCGKGLGIRACASGSQGPAPAELARGMSGNRDSSEGI